MSLSRHNKPKRHAHHFVQIDGWGGLGGYYVLGYANDLDGQPKPQLAYRVNNERGIGNIQHVESFRAELFVLFGLRTRVVTFHLPRRPRWAPPKFPSLEPRP